MNRLQSYRLPSYLIYCLYLLWMFAGQIALSSSCGTITAKVVTEPEQSNEQTPLQTVEKFAQKAFKKHATPEQNFELGVIVARCRRHFGTIKLTEEQVETQVVAILEQSRDYAENVGRNLDSLSKGELKRDLIRTVGKAQALLDAYFPKITGREFPVKLLDSVMFHSNKLWGDYADPIAGRIYVTMQTVGDPDLLMRILVHENLHLAGLSDSPTLIYGASILREAIIEGLTQQIFLAAKKDGKKLNPKYSNTYLEYVEAVDRIVTQSLFAGDSQALIDFYNSGDIQQFSEKLRKALKKQSSKVPRNQGIEENLRSELKVLAQMEVK